MSLFNDPAFDLVFFFIALASFLGCHLAWQQIVGRRLRRKLCRWSLIIIHGCIIGALTIIIGSNFGVLATTTFCGIAIILAGILIETNWNNLGESE